MVLYLNHEHMKIEKFETSWSTYHEIRNCHEAKINHFFYTKSYVKMHAHKKCISLRSSCACINDALKSISYAFFPQMPMDFSLIGTNVFLEV